VAVLLTIRNLDAQTHATQMRRQTTCHDLLSHYLEVAEGGAVFANFDRHESDELLGRSSRRDVTVDRPLDTSADLVWLDEDLEVDSSPLASSGDGDGIRGAAGRSVSRTASRPPSRR
jgi:hypothetical protein